jgi:type III secretory pathway component EscS
MELTSDELRNYATIMAALVALVVFVFNSRVQLRNQRIENISRFFEVHSRLMAADGFLMTHLVELGDAAFRRDPTDRESEARFHLLLLQVEQLAILANNKAVPRSTQVYMFGLYSRSILGLLTEKERTSMFWDLAVNYLHGLAELTDEYERMPASARKRFQR